MFQTRLENRCVLEVNGADALSFLQGLVTNDIPKVTSSKTLYGALLNPQGKFLHDFMIWKGEESSFYLTPEKDRAGDLLKRLTLYKLRSQVTLHPREDLHLYALWGGNEPQGERGDTSREGDVLQCIDPRLKELGSLVLTPAMTFKRCQEKSLEAYDGRRLGLGVPDGSRDMKVERAIPLECGLDELDAVSWDKGCYMGQELNARTRYRGLVRKRLFPVRIEGPLPPNETSITLLGADRGEMHSHVHDLGLARLRIEDVEQKCPLMWGEARLEPFLPSWMASSLIFQEAKGNEAS